MSSLQEILGNLGITPETLARSKGPTRVGQYQRARHRTGMPTGIPQASAPVSVETAQPTNLRFGALDFSQAPQYGEAPKPDKGFLEGGGIGGFVGDLLDVVDTPRAALISAAKQAGKAASGDQDASWDEFWDDTSRNMGFQEVLDDAGMAGGWQRSALGVLGDVVTDPTTYVGVGALNKGKTALEAGEAALRGGVRQAVKSGGRESISKALGEAALETGLHTDDTVRKLVAESGRRGRGAVTGQGLRRAGVSAETAERLGVPQLSKTFVGKAIPGTKILQESIENGKGALKSVLGDSNAATVYRNLRITNAGGRSKLLTDLRRTKDADKGFIAVASMIAAQSGKREGYMWADLASRKARDLLGDDLKKMSPEDAAALTHAVESGVQSEITSKARQLMSDLRESLIARGVEIGELDNYVPHRLTKEARSSVHPDVVKYVRKMDSASFFENMRTLKAGDTFLGAKLATGSIKEINDISNSVLGYKVFKDDFRDLAADYMAQGGQTVMRKEVELNLAKYGVAVESKGKALLDDTQGKALKEAEEAAAKVRQAQDIQLTNGVKVRMGEEATVMRKALVRERKAIAGRVRTLKVKMANAQRAQYDLTQRIARLEGEIPAIQANIEAFRKVAASQRGAARSNALARVRRLEASLKDKVSQRDMFQKQAQSFLQKGARGEGRAAANSFQRMQEEVAALDERLAGVRNDADTLLQSNKALGEGTMPSEVAIRAERETADWIHRTVSKDATEVTNLLWSTIDDQRQLDWLLKADTEMGVAYGKLRKVQGRMNKKASDYQAVRAYVGDARRIIESPEYSQLFGSEIDLVRNLEASAAAYDMQAWKLGTQAKGFEGAARAMRAPGFGKKLEYEMEHGLRKLTADGRLGVPSWVAEAMDAEGILSDPKFWPQAADYMAKFENLWKGWAVGRPGFLIRNAYSSGFSAYLEAGPGVYNSIAQFKKFFKMYRSDPNGYMGKAAARWGADMAAKMDEALSVISATGGGLAASEFHTGFLHTASWKPWSSDFGYIKGIRSANEVVEGVIRGGHSLDILKRGGTVGTAIDTIEKYHFNYRDITRLDKGIKHVAPFWTFFANNVALQAYVWTHNVDKLNRTYFNVRRNMGYGDPDEQGAPGWMERNMGLPFATNPEGDSTYLNVGIPSIDFARDVAGTVERPLSLMGQTAPWVQLPAQAVHGKNFYTGRELTGVREAGLYGNIPGLGIPTGSGGEALTPMQLDILNGLLPGAGNLNRLSGGGDGLNGKSLLSMMTGISPQQLTPSMRRSASYSQVLAERERKKRERQLAGM